MLSQKKKESKFPKMIPEKKIGVLKELKSCDRIFKGEPLVKQNMPTYNRKTDKVTREHYREHLDWMGNQDLCCLECGTRQNLELHHPVPQDNRTVVPFCSYCHRGEEKNIVDNKRGRAIKSPEDKGYESLLHKPSNGTFAVTLGYSLHNRTRSGEFNKKWNMDELLKTAESFVVFHENEIGRKLKK
jgi:hypothetical protein